MSTDKGIQISSDRQKWAKILSTLVHMVQTQKIQLESMGKERKLLEDRTKILYDRWVSDVRLSEDQISQMKSDFVLEELARSLDMAKSDFVVGSKQREALLYKIKLGHTDNELADLKQLFDHLSQKCSNSKDISGGNSMETKKGKGGGRDSNMKYIKNSKEEERHSKILEGEVSRLKHENEKLSLKKTAEVSALLLEKDFVWNQYKTMESNYNNKLRSKDVEVEQANEKIEKLLAGMEELQSLNNERDVTIVTLKTKLSEMEADTKKRNEEISSLSRELKLIRKPGSASVTPKLRSKHVQFEQSNEKIEKLLASMEQLQSLNNEKDATIVTLKTKLAKMEVDTNKRNEEISRLSRELELLRKSGSASVTPALNRCSVRPRISGLGGKNSGSERSNVFVKKDAAAMQVPHHLKDTEKGSRSSKRKGVDAILISETPKLFSSTFKVPKLKKSPSIRS